MLSINFNVRDVVLEHSWYVDLQNIHTNMTLVNTNSRRGELERTSGKVPFENTINKQVWKGGQRRALA